MKISIFIFIFISALSYNQPKFCSNASWDSNATTFADSSILGSSAYGIFVDGINTVYVVSQSENIIYAWTQGSTSSTKNISGSFNLSYSIFVSILGDIYVDNGYFNNQVDKFPYNSTDPVPIMNVNGSCYGLFIDMNNTIYCSLADYHQIIKLSLYDEMNMTTIAAGNGSNGSTSNMLNSPHGIYVDNNFKLYVADCGNNRIQLFQSGQLNATTVAGSGSSNTTIALNCPTGVVLDAHGYLFIVDSGNNRIVGSGPYGFRCLVGCSNSSGSSSTYLHSPQSMAFDSYGNIFVTDMLNNRTQKFILATDPCGRCDNNLSEN
jgi:secreted PhoX family phosphatase